MLEARLLVKLVEAKTMWETPPYYTNDAQDILKEAVAMAVDTEWEDKLDRVLNPEYRQTYELLQETFLANHPDVTRETLYDGSHHTIEREFAQICEDAVRQDNDLTITSLNSLVEMLCTAIGDKVHRRNLQIADLKKEPEQLKSRINRATLVVNEILADIDAEKLDRQTDTLKERIGKINLALLR